MKRILNLIIIFVIGVCLCGCGPNISESSDKLQIVATLFPQYDFVREIAGDKADVVLLAPAGADGHTYEPTPAEFIGISQSDMFIYTGQYMESWASRIIESVSSDKLKVVDVSKNIELKQVNHHHGDHEENYDAHIWTNPLNAKVMVDNILAALCEIDGENADYYADRAENYKKQLGELDKMFEQTVSEAKTNKMIFGDSFAFLYFAERYGIEYIAAFDTCSSEAEPGVREIAQIIDEVKENNISAVYYSELSNKKVPQSIAEETGAQPLLFHSCHTVTDKNVTYLSLMNQNLENLKKGLN